MKTSTAKNFQYTQLLHSKNIQEAEDWCRSNFGPHWDLVGEGTWFHVVNGKDPLNHRRFYFENERDYLWFQLRWQ